MASSKSRNTWVELGLRIKLLLSVPFQGQSGLAKKFDAADEDNAGPRLHSSSHHGNGLLPVTNIYYNAQKPNLKTHKHPIYHLESRATSRLSSKRGCWRSPLGITFTAVLALLTLLIAAFFAPFISSATQIPVNGTTERFTILILSYGPRLKMLQGAIRHYSQCPSAESVVVIWNAGALPDPTLLAASSKVPVRLRVEQKNSLNNRFKPDKEILTRAVFSVDDDIRIPCRDVESAFAEWRQGPEAMVGFFPRLIEPLVRSPLDEKETVEIDERDRTSTDTGNLDGSSIESSEDSLVSKNNSNNSNNHDNKMAVASVPVFRGEPYAIQRGEYNAVLTGAAFIDATRAFELYWADNVLLSRAVVDEVFNGEDLLMNYVLWNAAAESGQKHPAVRFYRPSRRIDISKLSSVGISHDMNVFLHATERYLAVFTENFGFPLKSRPFEWTLGKGHGPLFCEVATIGCTYF